MSLDVEYTFCKRPTYKPIPVKTYNSVRDFVHDSNAESVNGESTVREKQHIYVFNIYIEARDNSMPGPLVGEPKKEYILRNGPSILTTKSKPK